MSETEKKINKLTAGLTSKQIIALYFDDKALVKAPDQLYLINQRGKRLYYRFDEEGDPIFYLSLTTLISVTTPTSPFLTNWKLQKALEEGYMGAADDYARAKAAYGTFMHSEFAGLLINRVYDLDKVSEKLLDFIEKNNYPSEWINWADDLKDDILAFAQFMQLYNVTPLCIEQGFYHPDDGYATMIDLVCEMDDGDRYKSGQRAHQLKDPTSAKRITAIIDFKSGRKGFFEEHEIQLHGCLNLWNIHYPDKKVDKVFNWSPKAWRTKPDFNFKDQTESQGREKLPHLVQLARLEYKRLDSQIAVKKGMIDLDKDLSENISICELSELVKEKHSPSKPKK